MLAQLILKLQQLQENHSVFQGIKRGIERETLRVNASGELAATNHPKALGSKLTHPNITTDYSENLLELITQPYENVDDLLSELHDIHAYTLSCMKDELFWPLSMPCWLGSNDEIPVANYGSSNSGKMKMQYRRGLGHRYGRHMQTIAGLHYNFSLPEHFWKVFYENLAPHFEDVNACRNHYYMALIRNYLRFGWLIYYLFGASPAVHQTFFYKREAIPDFLNLIDKRFYIDRSATALRMSEIGYQSLVQDELHISFNSLEEYTADLKKATETNLGVYQTITEKFGPASQLNTSVLQIEAEFYAPIRPKQTFCPGKRPVFTLLHEGIEYLEVRAMDINPYEPMGINRNQILFMDVFMVYCLLTESPFNTKSSADEAHKNQIRAALNGQNPECFLLKGNQEIKLRDWAKTIISDLKDIASLLENEMPDSGYFRVIEYYEKQFESSNTLLSARYLDELMAKGSYIEHALQLARQHEVFFEEQALSKDKHQAFEALAKQSLAKQKEIEASDDISYEEYVRRYYEVYC